MPLEQPLRPAEPTARPGDLIPLREMSPDPDRTAHRADRILRVHVRAVGTLEQSHVLLPAAQHVGGGSESLQVVGSERTRPACG
jgi:hypothetical protein